MEFNLFSDHEFKPIKNLCDSEKGTYWNYLKATVILSADDEKVMGHSLGACPPENFEKLDPLRLNLRVFLTICDWILENRSKSHNN